MFSSPDLTGTKTPTSTWPGFALKLAGGINICNLTLDPVFNLSLFPRTWKQYIFRVDKISLQSLALFSLLSYIWCAFSCDLKFVV
jgi:hypothetical protein